MNKFLCAIFVLGFLPNANARWFDSKDSLSSAHDLLLSGNVSGSFEQLVQLWQQQPEPLIGDNMNALLGAAIGVDCGRSLTPNALPEWLMELAVQRETVQHVNQVNYSVNIEGLSNVNSLSIDLVQWPEENVISGRTAVSKGGQFKMSFRHFSDTLPRGLYRLSLSTANHPEWNQWLILEDPATVQRITWVDTFNWHIANHQLPMKTCPVPVLEQQVYPLDRLYQRTIWQQRDQGRLPTVFNAEETELNPGRYWLSVSLIDSRWQGDLQVQEVQRLIKPTEVHAPATIIEVTDIAF